MTAVTAKTHVGFALRLTLAVMIGLAMSCSDTYAAELYGRTWTIGGPITGQSVGRTVDVTRRIIFHQFIRDVTPEPTGKRPVIRERLQNGNGRLIAIAE